MFKNGNKFAGCDQPLLGMAPAHQRLTATIAIAMEIVLGLQIDNKLAVFKGIFHLVDDLFFIADFFAKKNIGMAPALVLGGLAAIRAPKKA